MKTLTGPIACLLAVAAASSGCDRAEIRTYRAPKGAAAADSDSGASAPGGGGSGKKPSWQVPDGWKRLEQSGRMRVAAFRAGAGAKAPTVTVTALPGRAGGVSANVNRWRRQLGLEPASGKALREDLDPLGGGADGVVADLRNDKGKRIVAVILTGAPERSWFVKVRDNAERVGGVKDELLGFARSFRWSKPSRSAKGTATPSGDPPEGWEAAAPEDGERLAFRVKSGGRSARVAVTAVPGGRAALARVNKWRREIGLEPVAALEKQPVTRLDEAAAPAALIDLCASPQKPGADRLLVAMLSREKRTWFVRMKGPNALLEKQRDALVRYLASLRFGEKGDS